MSWNYCVKVENLKLQNKFNITLELIFTNQLVAQAYVTITPRHLE